MPSDLTTTITDLEQQTEGSDLEAKLAVGRDGRGELPRNVFETYSAMANTDGGIVLLGVRELDSGRLEVAGIPDIAKVQKALWDGLNNRQQVSANILRNDSVDTFEIDGRQILRLVVPRAERAHRPVFVGKNPLEGTFRRNHEGDYRCSAEDVRRMLADQIDERDGHIVRGLSIEHLDRATLARYRQHFRALKPDHIWNNADDLEFLRQIGAWRRDLASNQEGITEAGLLMFGKMVEIQDHFPTYMLDFQERPDAKADVRWTDRFTLDGSWSGNVFDFYQAVILRLTRELRVPFKLKGDTRIDDTPVHEAIREALINTLVHADYTGSIAVLVVKRPDVFVFRNPGMLRISLDAALAGGTSDCRNRRLQQMFRYVNLGEQAGSGLPKVYASWRSQHWRAPELLDKATPYEQTVFTLRMASLLPEITVAELERRFGEVFRSATEVQKLALVTVALERKVTHARLRSMTGAHPRDITIGLASLVQKGVLETGGAHKRTFYFFPGAPPPEDPALGFDGAAPGETPAAPEVEPSSHRNTPSSHHSEASSHRNAPSSHHNEVLLELAAPFREKQRLSRETAEGAILALCTDRYLTLSDLSEITGRAADTLRNHYLNRLLSSGKLRLRFPENPTHPGQSYTKA